jgi:hypothetical protein
MKHVHKTAKLALRIIKIGLISILTLGIVHCTSDQKKTETPVDVSWSTGMQGMAKNLDKLMPYVFSSKEFNDPKNNIIVKKMISNFADGVEGLPRHAGEELLGKDPIVKYSIARLQTNSRRAQQAFIEGSTEYSRHILSENVSLCFSCHSTQNIGPQNNFATTLDSKFRLYPNERADYYVATRQFDKAIETLDSVVQSPAALLENPHEQMNALRKYLFLQVRIKNDPGPAILLLDKYLAWDRLPYFMAQDAQAWMNSLKVWQMEKKGSKNSTQLAQKLLNKSDNAPIQGYQSGLVDYLRASMLLHANLRFAKTAKEKAQIYGLLGESYETLAELGIWDLPEVYYEACVRTLPYSVEAQKCYKNFERSIILGFSGSAGIYIPKDERERMVELRRLSGLKTGKIEKTEDTLQAE